MAFYAIKHAFGFKNFMKSFSSLASVCVFFGTYSHEHESHSTAGLEHFYSQRAIIHKAKLFCEPKLNTNIDFFAVECFSGSFYAFIA